MARAKKKEVTEDLFAELREEAVEEPVVEKPVAMATPKAEPKKPAIKKVEQPKFTDKDLIPCKSVTSGGLSFIGTSGNKYRWENYGIIEYVEYGDLRREAQSANPTNYLYYPRFVVVDPEFVEQFPKLEEFYSQFYNNNGDFENILNLPKEQMKEAIDKLPKGCKECIKGIIATQIDEGSLDSVAKIKMLDEIFGTNMLLMIANN